MTDEEIVELYWNRDETAIEETGKKYGAYLHTIVWNILAQEQDTEECVNDTYFKTWGSIPRNRPGVLSLYLGKIARAVAVDTYRRRHAQKRIGSEYAMSLSELSDTFSDGKTPEDLLRTQELLDAIDHFLRNLTPKARQIFLGRYYFFDSVKTIAGYCGVAEGTVKSSLHRTRQALRTFLNEEGFDS